MAKNDKYALADKASKSASMPTKKPIPSYKCTCCGTTFQTQRGHFYSTRSPLYAANGGYLPVCKDCTERRYQAALATTDGREDIAIERVCQTFDWFYSPAAFNYAVSGMSAGQSLLSSYVGRLGLTAVSRKGDSYLDTLRRESEGDPEAEALRKELDEKNAPPEPEPEWVEKWGTGYSMDEYAFLNVQYEALSGKIIEGDDVSESIVRDLCQLKVLQNRAAKANDDAAYIKYQKAYTDTLKSPDLRSAKSKGGAVTDAQASWGKFIEMVERYTPAEYYQDEKMFDDASGIKEYFKRFFVRPFKNFFTGSTELDPEYSVKQEDVESD